MFVKISAQVLQACNSLRSGIKRTGELAETVQKFRQCETSNASDKILTTNWLCGIVVRNDYHFSQKLFLLARTFIDRSDKGEKKANMTTVHTCYSEIATDVKRDIALWLWQKEDQRKLEKELRSSRGC